MSSDARETPVSHPAGLRVVLAAGRTSILRLLTARLRDASEAEDVLQDMWLKLERAPTGPIAEPLAYLHRMAMNSPATADVRSPVARRGTMAGRPRNQGQTKSRAPIARCSRRGVWQPSSA